MNGNDKKDLNVIIQRMEQSDKDRELMHQDIKFIKENLFNPREGLWAESRLNTQFRLNTSKWRMPIGLGFISLAVKHVWDMFTGT